MKTILIILTCITLFSCSKDPNKPDAQQPSPSGSIQYKINGNLVVLDNVDYAAGQYTLIQKQLKGSLYMSTRYLFEAQKGSNNALLFPIITDSIHQTNYHIDSTMDQAAIFSLTVYNGNESALHFSGDYLDVTITSYKDGRISGNFTGKLTPFASSTVYGLPGTTLITEGVINNVQVIY